jgi:putative oxygen-independent coproporphyrinogen III oxidase
MSFGIYVHWPWCESKCPYCDFNSHVGGGIDPDRWSAAFRAEIRRLADTYPDEIVESIFIGGGTPSLMPPSVMETVIDEVCRAWRTGNAPEITMEANPSSVEVDRFRAYRLAGVNRVSVGIQALDDRHLRLLGRKHSRDEAIKAISVANRVFDRVNLDLMYGRQYQSDGEWRAELTEALSFGTEHLSLYQLTIEDGTVFGRRHAAGQLPGLPEEALSVTLYDITQELTSAAGLQSYEVSNHAREGAECRHNLIYWRSGAWAGIGPGAHGRLRQAKRRIATETHRDPAAWLRAVESDHSGELRATQLRPTDVAEEALLMGLRLSEGVPMQKLRELGIDTATWPSRDQLVEDGLLVQDETLRTTARGRLLLNAVLQMLCSDLTLFEDGQP